MQETLSINNDLSDFVLKSCSAFEAVRKCENTVFDENAGNSRLE